METTMTNETDTGLIDRLVSAINDIKCTYKIGLRVVEERPEEAGANPGTILEPSWNWVDGCREDELLAGTSAIGVDTWAHEAGGDDLRQAVAKAVGLLRPYHGKSLLVIAGRHAGYGDDEGEVLIANAEVMHVDVWPGRVR